MTAGATTRGLPIEFNGLTKHFGPVLAVDDLSFTVEPGRVTGFLGPNGSGKTTTLRMLLGLVHPSAGTATVGGRNYWDLENPSSTVGAVLEATSFHPARRARTHLRMAARAGGHARRPGRRGARAGRPEWRRQAQGRRLLHGHAPAARAGDGAHRRSRRPHPRRAVERPRPPGHRLVARLHAVPGRRGAHRARVLAPPLGNGPDHRRRRHRLVRPAQGAGHARADHLQPDGARDAGPRHPRRTGSAPC